MQSKKEQAYCQGSSPWSMNLSAGCNKKKVTLLPMFFLFFGGWRRHFLPLYTSVAGVSSPVSSLKISTRERQGSRGSKYTRTTRGPHMLSHKQWLYACAVFWKTVQFCLDLRWLSVFMKKLEFCTKTYKSVVAAIVKVLSWTGNRSAFSDSNLTILKCNFASQEWILLMRFSFSWSQCSDTLFVLAHIAFFFCDGIWFPFC